MANNWPLVGLGDIFAIARGGSPRPIQKFITDDPDGVNWIMISDATEGNKYITSTNKRIIQEGVEKSRLVKPGDFLLTNSMSFGKPFIMKTTGCIHDGWLVLSPKSSNIDVDYFYYLLGSKFVYLEFARRASGATVKNLNIGLVKSVQVPLPPLAEQQRIAAILDKADALRAKRRAALAKLDTLLQATFLDMFGDPVTNPNDWDELILDDVCEKITDGTHFSPPIVEEGIPYVTAKHIRNGQVVFESDPWFVSKKDHEKIYKRCDPKLGDVLYIKDGVTTGMAAINEYDFEFSMLSSLALLRVKSDICTSYYLREWLNNPLVKRMMLESLGGAAIKRLTLMKIKSKRILIPPIELQEQFEYIIFRIESERKRLEQSQEHFNSLFKSLQQRAFKGGL